MLTRKRNLRTGRPVWTAYSSPRIPHTPLQKDIEVDVAVIGAGVSGAMVAEELADAGFSVVILDRRGPLKGSTAASTALLQYEIDTPLTVLADKIGTDRAVRGWQRSREGLENLAVKIRTLNIDCDIRRRDSVYLDGDVLDAAQLRGEQAMRIKAGLPGEIIGQSAVHERYGIDNRTALVVPDSIEVNPLRLAGGFLLAALKKGAAVYAPVQVDDVETGMDKVRIMTDTGRVVTVRHAVFATGYEVLKQIPLKGHEIHSTWAIATKRQPKALWPGRAFIWEASSPYLYIRTTPDGRVICGGEDEDFSDAHRRDSLLPAKIETLQRKLAALLPQLDTRAAYAWTGAFGGSKTDMPSIGPVPGMPNCYAVLAFGGNGITFSRIAAEVVRAMLTGVDDPDADLYRIE